MVFKISVDDKKCIGCGSCVSVCSEGFVMSNGKAIPKNSEVEEISCEPEAEAMCPASAIKIEKI